MWSTTLIITLLVLSGPCESGCPDESSPGNCSVDCAGTSLDRLPSLPAEQLKLITHISITNCHTSEINWRKDNLSHIIALDLSYNSIVDIDQDLLKSLTSLTHLNLRGNAISVLNDRCLEGSKDLQTLDLSSNNISTLLGSPFEASHLVRLNVSRNRISSLTKSSLRGLDNLELIDLSSNLISALDNSLFRTFSSLQWLNLSGNHLSTLSEGYFLGLSGLQRLDVSVNCISHVSGSGSAESLSGLTEVVLAGNPLGARHKELMVLVGTGRRLQTVDASGCNLTEIPGTLTWSIRFLKLAHNQLVSIRRGDLDSYPLLHELDLSNNLISEIEEDALGRLESLSSLVLVGNRLNIVPNSLPSGLRVLHLDHNNIQYLNVGDLGGLPHLRELTLRDTRLMGIQDGAFSCVPGLEVLDLSDNPLERLSGSVLAGPQTLTTLQLSHLNQVTSDIAKDMSFPLSSPERLQVLELQGSPVVARQLLADPAALAAFRDLHTLDLRNNQLTRLRSDLFHFLPRLEALGLADNPWACDDMLWLAKWMQQQLVKGTLDEALCEAPPRFKARRIRELTDEDFVTPTTNSPLPSFPTQVSKHMDNTHINDSLNVNNDSKKETFENQFLNKSSGSDSKLKFPSMPAAPGLNSLVKTTNVDSSFNNKTHPKFLSTVAVNEDKRLKNARQISDIFNERPLVKSSLNSTADRVYNTNNKTKDKATNNITSENRNLTVNVSESLVDKNKFHGFNNITQADNKDLYKTTALPPAVLSDIVLRNAESLSHLNKTSTNVMTGNNTSILSPKRTWSALRNANKKGQRDSIKIHAMNVTNGEKVFNKMMRDRLPNNPLRTNENFSRLKSSSYGFRDTVDLGSINPSHNTLVDPVASSATIPGARSITRSQIYPVSTPAPEPAPASSPTILATPPALDSLFPVRRLRDHDRSSNSSIVWGTLKTYVDENSSVAHYHDPALSEMLIGVIRKSIDSKSNMPKIDTVKLLEMSELFNKRQPVEKVTEPSHPGMYVIVALVLGIASAFLGGIGHFLLKRKRAVEYSRQQDIEVRSMNNEGEIW